MNQLQMICGLVVLAVSLTACGPNTSFTLPDDFVALDEDSIEWEPYDWKAVNIDGAVVVLRERENEEEGSMEFWVKALQRELSEGRGYQLLEMTDVETRNMKGKQLRFEVDHAGTPYHYTVAVFLADDNDCIVTVETANRAQDHEAHSETLQAIVESAKFD